MVSEPFKIRIIKNESEKGCSKSKFRKMILFRSYLNLIQGSHCNVLLNVRFALYRRHGGNGRSCPVHDLIQFIWRFCATLKNVGVYLKLQTTIDNVLNDVCFRLAYLRLTKIETPSPPDFRFFLNSKTIELWFAIILCTLLLFYWL